MPLLEPRYRLPKGGLARSSVIGRASARPAARWWWSRLRPGHLGESSLTKYDHLTIFGRDDLPQDSPQFIPAADPAKRHPQTI